MAEWVNALATKMDNLSSILGAHIMEAENWLPQFVLLPPPHMLWAAHAHPHPLKNNECNLKIKTDSKVNLSRSGTEC